VFKRGKAPLYRIFPLSFEVTVIERELKRGVASLLIFFPLPCKGGGYRG